CSNSFYGENCAQNCGNCLDGSRCNLKNGTCPRGCSSGYRGVYCNQSTVLRELPLINLTSTPSFNCSYLSWRSNYYLKNACFFVKSSVACAAGRYGHGCLSNCSGNCFNKLRCHFSTGSCSYGCASGYDYSIDTSCGKACNNGRFGQNCSSHCGHCIGAAVCDHVSGNCPIGGCERGFNGSRCQTTCLGGKFGKGCNFSCGSCRNLAICNNINGSCIDGCEKGHFGLYCQKG
ncbi:TIE1-like protein, partial [Mya arenaria]